MLGLSLGLLMIFTSIWIILKIQYTNQTIKELKENLFNQQKVDLKYRVDNLLSLIEAQRATSDKTEDELKDEILNWVATLRFEYGGYFFINQTDGRALIFDGQRVTEDRNILDMQDPNGLRIFDRELEAFHQPEGAFMTYLFKRIETETPEEKVSYMRGIQDWNWIVGAGNYVQDLSSQINQLRSTLNQDLKKSILIILGVFLGVFILLFFVAQYLAFNINKHINRMESLVDNLMNGKKDPDPMKEKLFFKEQNNFAQKLKTVIGQKLQAEKELKKALTVAERNAYLKTAFLNNLSHEIRTPLNSIVGFSNLLLDPDVDLKTKENYLQIVNRSSENLLNMLNEILYVARYETDENVKLDYSYFNVSNLLHDVAELFLPTCQEQNLELIIQSNPDFPELVVNTDRNKVMQVLNSLVSNALKFTPEGSVTIGYQVSDNQCIFQVEDTGIGIRQEETNLVFDSFYQVDNSLSKNYSGIGLGLNIAQKIVHILGGQIGVESEIDKGSLFYFSIPLNQNNQND